MNKNEYNNLENSFAKIYAAHKSNLDSDAKNEIEHFVHHGELETAFEGFCIEMIQNELVLEQDERNQILDLAKALNLDKESVLDANIWTKLQVYINEQL